MVVRAIHARQARDIPRRQDVADHPDDGAILRSSTWLRIYGKHSRHVPLGCLPLLGPALNEEIGS